jgi:amino acid transporter
MKDAPFNRGFLAGVLVMIGAQAVGWFIQSPSAADASALRTAAVIVQAVIGFGGATWLYARERGRATRTS